MVQGNTARNNMVKSQILTRHVLNPSVLNALMNVKRELFVPESLQNAAYSDDEIALGNGRFLIEPLAFARILEHAHIGPQDTVLDVGAATGYSSALLSFLAQKVVALEEDNMLINKARPVLSAYANIECVEGALQKGVSQKAPYDIIIIEGAIQLLPQMLIDQLREGGKLLTVEHAAKAKVAVAGLGKLVEYKKLRGVMYKTILEDANISLLPAFKKPLQFIL